MLAKTTVAEASQQLVIQALVPFRTHESPSARAVVEAAPASLPFPAPHADSESMATSTPCYPRAQLPTQQGAQPQPPAGEHSWAPNSQGLPLEGAPRPHQLPKHSEQRGREEGRVAPGQLQAKGTPGPRVPPSVAEVTTQVSTGPSSCLFPRGSQLQPDSVTLILREGKGSRLSYCGTWFTEGKAANLVTAGERCDPLLLLLLGAKLQDGPQVEGLWGQRGAVGGLPAQEHLPTCGPHRKAHSVQSPKDPIQRWPGAGNHSQPPARRPEGVGGTHVVDTHDDASGGTAPADLLDGDGVGQVVEASATQLLRHVHGQKPKRAHLLHLVLGKDVVAMATGSQCPPSEPQTLLPPSQYLCPTPP